MPDDGASPGPGVPLGLGVAGVFTPEDFAITDIVRDLVPLIRAAHGLAPPPLEVGLAGLTA